MNGLQTMTESQLLLLIVLTPCIAFHVPTRVQTKLSRLHGISEWRDNCFVDQQKSWGSSELRKPLCLVPFDFEEALVQGQTKELRFFEERFIKLFQDVMDNHEGVLAMALLSEEDEAILSSVPICEVVNYNRMVSDGFGIFLTIQCVGRVELLEVDQDGEYMIAECVEIVDSSTSLDKVEEGNLLAESIEKMIERISAVENELSDRLEEQVEFGTLPDGIVFVNDSDNFVSSEDDDEDDDDDDDENDDSDTPTRVDRYNKAYLQALESDSQGYYTHQLSNNSPSPRLQQGKEQLKSTRSIQELTAISWAVFATEVMDDLDAQFRVQALDTQDLVERLKLGLFLLNEKRRLIERMLQQVRSDMEDNNS